jgi:Protein of unknown function (DUF1059)
VDKVLHCHCGFEARAARAEEFVAEVRRHAWEAHAMALTDEEALLVAFRAQLDGDRPTAIPRLPNHPEKEK